jgi:hypothetical protein
MRFGHVGVIDAARSMLDSSVVSEISVPEHPDMRYVTGCSLVYASLYGGYLTLPYLKR